MPLGTIKKYEIGYRCIDGAGLNVLVALSEALECNIYDILQDEELIEKLKDVFNFVTALMSGYLMGGYSDE